MAPEAIAVLMATKTKDDCSKVMCNIRTCLINDHGHYEECAGSSERCTPYRPPDPTSNVALNLIPELRRIDEIYGS